MCNENNNDANSETNSENVLVKSPAAKEVLQLLDSDEDAPNELKRIVELVAGRHSMTVNQLNKEIDAFI